MKIFPEFFRSLYFEKMKKKHRYISMFFLKTSMLKNIDVFRTSPNTIPLVIPCSYWHHIGNIHCITARSIQCGRDNKYSKFLWSGIRTLLCLWFINEGTLLIFAPLIRYERDDNLRKNIKFEYIQIESF